MRHTPPWVVSLALLVLALSGCVGVDDGTGDHMDDGHMADGHHHGTAGGAGEGNLALTGAEDVLFNVTAGDPDELRFVPERIEVQSGQRVGIVFSNEGNAEHEFSIDAIEFHLHAESGETEQGAFIAPTPGEYVIGCYVPGHFESGMKGTLVVT